MPSPPPPQPSVVLRVAGRLGSTDMLAHPQFPAHAAHAELLLPPRLVGVPPSAFAATGSAEIAYPCGAFPPSAFTAAAASSAESTGMNRGPTAAAAAALAAAEVQLAQQAQHVAQQSAQQAQHATQAAQHTQHQVQQVQPATPPPAVRTHTVGHVAAGGAGGPAFRLPATLGLEGFSTGPGTPPESEEGKCLSLLEC